MGTVLDGLLQIYDALIKLFEAQRLLIKTSLAGIHLQLLDLKEHSKMHLHLTKI